MTDTKIVQLVTNCEDMVAPERNGHTAPEPTRPKISGGAFILDQPSTVPAIWGTGNQVLWADGEGLMIAGPQGVGKTTLLGQLVKALLGITNSVLGLPVRPVDGKIGYLAMDRPRQISRSLARQFSEEHRAILDERFVPLPGPPPADLAAHPTLLLGIAEEYELEILLVDSLKDAAVGLTDDTVAASYNRARQHLLASGRNLAELHHVVKRSGKDGPITLADVYGSVWLTSGVGSVLMLTGEAGDPIVKLSHPKQPAEEVGPYQLSHDQETGTITITHQVDILMMATAAKSKGITAKTVAQATTDSENPNSNAVEKARRKLDRLVKDDALVKRDGKRGRGATAATYFLAAFADQITAETTLNLNHAQITDSAKPQVNKSRTKSTENKSR